MNLTQYEMEMIQILRANDIGTIRTLYAVLQDLDEQVDTDVRMWGRDSWQANETIIKRNKFKETLREV